MRLSFVWSAASVLAVFALGCSDAKEQDRGLEGGGEQGGEQVGTPTGGTEVNPYGVAYPTSNLGVNARAGTRPGNRIANYKFYGYVGPHQSKELKVISMADFFDPETRNYKVIWFSAASRWCTVCQSETAEMVKVVDELAAKKVIFIQALVDGLVTGRGATVNDLDKWSNDRKLNFPVMLDPGVKNLGEFFQASAVPWNAAIDARSMEVLSSSVGAPPSITSAAERWIRWVDQNPPQE
jgi:hypothetical protein